MAKRQPLTGQRIVEAAVSVADEGGLAAVSMRNVGAALGVQAMSLYHHVPNKDALLDALLEWVFARVELPVPGDDWRSGMTLRAQSVRDVLVAHPWALSLIETRSNPGLGQLRHHDAAFGCLREGGFSIDLAAEAISAIDAYVYGFALTENNLPFDAESGSAVTDFAQEVLPALAEFPYLKELVVHLTSTGQYTFSDQFESGLDLILDQLTERLENR